MSSSEVLCEKLDALNEDNWEQLEESNSFTTRSHQGTNENHQPCNGNSGMVFPYRTLHRRRPCWFRCGCFVWEKVSPLRLAGGFAHSHNTGTTIAMYLWLDSGFAMRTSGATGALRTGLNGCDVQKHWNFTGNFHWILSLFCADG